MKVVFHNDFYDVYTFEPAAAAGRMEAVMACLGDEYEVIQAVAATAEDIEAVHTARHIEYIHRQKLYNIAALAAGGAIQAATIGLKEPAFALIRPPGHHASQDDCWGFCYFNNMAIALTHLLNRGLIKTAAVLDFDLHYGDGNVNILDGHGAVDIYNPDQHNRQEYLRGVESFLKDISADIIGVSAGFDNHELDWGRLLKTEDYYTMGQMVKAAAQKTGAGYFGLLEGGYNHSSLALSVRAFLEGMA